MTDPPGDNQSESSESLPTESAPKPESPAPTVAAGSSGDTEKPAAPSPLGLRAEVPRWLSFFAGIACILLGLLAWWLATRGSGEERWLGHNQLPSISETVERFPEVLDSESRERHLWDNTLVSLKRVLIGFSLALAVGIPIGIAAGCFPVVRSFFAPVILFGRNIPIAALIPLVLALFGTGELQKVMFIFVACAAFIISDTIDAVNEVAQRYVETALTLGASSLQIVFKVLVPLAMPMVFNSLRVLFGLAFGYIMLVESISAAEGAGGLGFLLNIARKRSITEYTVIIILTIPLLAWVIDQILYVIQCWIFRWKYGDEAERSTAFRLSRWIAGWFWKPVRSNAVGTSGPIE